MLAWIGVVDRIMCECPLRLPAALRTCEQQVRFSLHPFNLAPLRRRTGLCQFRRRGGAFTERVKRKSYLLLVGTRGEPGGEGGEGGGGWLRVGVRHRHTWGLGFCVENAKPAIAKTTCVASILPPHFSLLGASMQIPNVVFSMSRVSQHPPICLFISLGPFHWLCFPRWTCISSPHGSCFSRGSWKIGPVGGYKT